MWMRPRHHSQAWAESARRASPVVSPAPSPQEGERHGIRHVFAPTIAVGSFFPGDLRARCRASGSRKRMTCWSAFWSSAPPPPASGRSNACRNWWASAISTAASGSGVWSNSECCAPRSCLPKKSYRRSGEQVDDPQHTFKTLRRCPPEEDAYRSRRESGHRRRLGDETACLIPRGLIPSGASRTSCRFEHHQNATLPQEGHPWVLAACIPVKMDKHTSKN
jgi:hypothetical protein